MAPIRPPTRSRAWRSSLSLSRASVQIGATVPGRGGGPRETWSGKANFVDHNRLYNPVVCNRVTVFGPSTASKILVRAWFWQRRHRASPAKASSTVVYRIPEDAKASIRSCVRGLRGGRKSMVYILLEISKRADQNPTYSGGILCLDCRRHDDARSRRAGQRSQSRSIQSGPSRDEKKRATQSIGRSCP